VIVKKKKHIIVPVFVSHEGCPYRCSFCNQTNITGTSKKADRQMVRDSLRTHLENLDLNCLPEERELAFFGGSFTGIHAERQEHLLSMVQPWVQSGQIRSIRVSTHAFFIDDPRLSLLKQYNVKTVELGVQSTNNHVLKLVGRECTSELIQSSSKMIKEKGFRLGLQLMPGLPDDDEKIFSESVKDVIALKPDFVRIYPTLVIKNTGLFDMYKQGTFKPWSLERMLQAVKNAVVKFEKVGIPVIRIGLHPDKSMLDNFVEGPFHPSFRYLVDSRIARDKMISLIRQLNSIPLSITFQVPPKKISIYVGHKKDNLEILRRMFNLESVNVQRGSDQNSLKLVA
jgi:histone acetyltransferase (RNA polymerase elongator complex component)